MEQHHTNERLYHVLLVCLLLLFPLHALSSMAGTTGALLLAAGNAATILGCLVAMNRGKLRLLAIVLGVPAVVALFIEPEKTDIFTLSTEALSTAIYVFMIVVLSRRVFRRTRFTMADISAAMSIYLLLGLLWANLYDLLLFNDPEAFRVPEGLDESIHRSALFYFSFVTLTTLGYGDIAPVSPISMSLATLEAIVGQLFLVVGVATVVAHAGRSDPD